MQEDEQQLVVGAALYRQAGCLLVPFLPVRATGALTVTSRRLIFDPILHYKLLTRRFEIDLGEVSEAEATGSQFGLSFADFVRIGKDLKVKMKSGEAHTFRSVYADQLAEVINEALRQSRWVEQTGDGAQEPTAED